jgi:hypothetical protein
MICPGCGKPIKEGDLICMIDDEIAHEDCADAHAANEAMKDLTGGVSLDELHAALSTKH